MIKALKYLRITAIILFILTLAGLVADYMSEATNFPGGYTMVPMLVLIVTLLVMLVIKIYMIAIQQDR